MTEDSLVQARRHVAEAVERVCRQEGLLEELRRDGHDTTQASELLEQFQRTLRLMREHLAEEEAHAQLRAPRYGDW
jgi:hypothetical protein